MVIAVRAMERLHYVGVDCVGTAHSESRRFARMGYFADLRI
jgi:hypothetical protein